MDLPFPAKLNLAMFSWPSRYFVLSVISAVFGFGDIVGSFSGWVRILFVVFLILLIASTVVRGARGKSRTNYPRNSNHPQ